MLPLDPDQSVRPIWFFRRILSVILFPEDELILTPTALPVALLFCMLLPKPFCTDTPLRLPLMRLFRMEILFEPVTYTASDCVEAVILLLEITTRDDEFTNIAGSKMPVSLMVKPCSETLFARVMFTP